MASGSVNFLEKMRVFLLLSLCLCVFAQKNVDRIEARINGDIITESDVNEAVARQVFYLQRKYQKEEEAEKLEQEIKKVREAALENLINKKIVLFEFRTREYRIPGNIVDERINGQIERYAGGDKEEFFRLLEKENLSFQQLKKSIEESLAVSIMYNSFVYSKVNVGPKIKREYYKEHKGEFTLPEEVHLQGFVLKRSNYDTDKEFEDRLIRLAVEVGKSDDFTQLVQQNNEESGLATNGDYGWIKLPELNELFKKEVKNLKKGESSRKAVLTKSNGDIYAYFFHMKDRRGGGIIPYSEVKGKIENILRQKKGEPLLKSYLARLRNKSAIEIFNE